MKTLVKIIQSVIWFLSSEHFEGYASRKPKYNILYSLKIQKVKPLNFKNSISLCSPIQSRFPRAEHVNCEGRNCSHKCAHSNHQDRQIHIVIIQAQSVEYSHFYLYVYFWGFFYQILNTMAIITSFENKNYAPFCATFILESQLFNMRE